jgi:broad specificity phosphatase PhoE
MTEDNNINNNNKNGDDDDDEYQSIYFVRHAHKQDMKVGYDKYSKWTRPNDTPLSYEGTIMAMETGSYFDQLNRKGKIDKIIVSPALRCIQTAKPISEALGLQMNVEEGLYDIPVAGLYTCGTSDEFNKPKNVDGWDYPYYPWPTLVERKCYFTNINMDYKSTVKVVVQEKQPVDTKEVQKDFTAYVKRTMDVSTSILDQFPEDNICVVSHGLTIALMAAAIMKVPIQTLVGDFMSRKSETKGSLNGLPPMASVTRLYRRKGSNDEWNIDTSLVNHVDHITRTELTHGGLPKLPKEIMKNLAHVSKWTKDGIAANNWEVVERNVTLID